MVAAEIMPRSATTQTRPMESAAASDRRPAGASSRRGIAGHIGADRPAVAVDDEAEDHLLQIGPIVLGIAVLAQRLTALAVEGEAGGVHEHGGEVGEQVATAVKSLSSIRSLRQRGASAPSGFSFSSSPSQAMAGRSDADRAPPPRDIVVLGPRGAVAVGSRNEQTMQGGDEDGALDRNSNARSMSRRPARRRSRAAADPSNSSGSPIRLAAT